MPSTHALSVPAALVLSAALALAAPVRYEAEDAIINEGMTPKVALASASGGYYVQMRSGNLSFNVAAAAAGFYTVWASYSQTYGDSKTQNFIVNGDINGTPNGTIGFPLTGGAVDAPAPAFERMKAIGKVRFKAGANTLAITNNWGWVDIDYIEVAPYEPEPFTISTSLVTPNATENARKVYGFLRDNFEKKVISGVMASRVMENDGKYTPSTPSGQEEMAHVLKASGKLPALLGLDFIHGTGEQPNRPNGAGDWFVGYNSATLSLAEAMFKAGGIPIYCWHWRDPLRNSTSDGSFYTENTTFDLTRAFSNAPSYTTFNENSAEYKALLRDIDEVAGFLKTLADKNVPVLWRPLHEAAGGWFWWGAKGAAPCRALYRLMFERMVNHHKLNNLVWVWTTEESGNELGWYPGDEFVDIIGRDIYPPDNQRAKLHGSWVSSFENIKGIFGTNKIIALSENGAVPHPDSLIADGAGWSWFMSWDGDFTTSVNTAADWTYIMNHSYVITLDKMPGWGNVTAPPSTPVRTASGVAGGVADRYNIRVLNGTVRVGMTGPGGKMEVFNLKGGKISTVRLTRGENVVRLGGHLPKGVYVVKASSGGLAQSVKVMIK